MKNYLISPCKKTQCLIRKLQVQGLRSQKKWSLLFVNEHFSGKRNVEIGVFLQTLTIISLIFIFNSCKKDKTDPEQGKPNAVNLIFPFENSLCNVGTDSTDTESTVVFEWSESQNTDEYELILKNLITGDSSSNTTSELQIPLRILRAIPYAWYIVSKSNSHEKTAKSSTWKFYNAGEAIPNYAPFPAEIVSPAMAEIATAASVITLEWTGSDIDNDIVGYDVYFGTDILPPIIETDIQTNVLNNVSINTNTIYYWKIITKDAYGNISDSGTYQFKVE